MFKEGGWEVHRCLKTLGLVFGLVLLPALAFAQASITGVVKDPSGAVLPGVTVEVASPVLIEKTRTVVSDSSGEYRFVSLLPGTYSVSFTLTGFQTVKREGIELSGTFIATINAEMKVGAVEETITVSGVTPIVDTENVRRQTTLGGETLTEIPMAKSWAATAFLIPGITIQAGVSADIQVTPNMTVFGGAGGRLNEGRMQLDGLNVGAALNGGGVSTYVADIQNAAEVVTTTSGGLGEAEVGGPTLSIVPKSGGNQFKSSAYLGGVPSGWVQSNYTPALQAAGLATPGSEIYNWDFTGGEGGPIKKDALWFYVTARTEGEYRTIPGVFPNLNAGVPGQYLYKPDTSRVAEGAQSFEIFTGRLTYQATPRNKFNVHWDSQLSCNGATYDNNSPGCRQQDRSGAFVGALGLGGLTSQTSPETSGYLGHTLIQNRQVTWQSPVTNKLLLEAGLGSYRSRWGPMASPGNPTAAFPRITEVCAAGCAANGNIPGLIYNSANYANDWDNPNTWRASASYVTGAH
ncbi:MAG TPA: carboxypeptidase-like regulatory domain-containing protein, partial [Vicinamibacterales bacterium]|nr:carboxypeptidase-like regulatory domain-containing protein [Vicinamibacterales bacterium]